MPVIPVLRRLRQKNYEFKDNTYGDLVSKKEKKRNWLSILGSGLLQEAKSRSLELNVGLIEGAAQVD
jgi:hypothetical protein